MNISRRGSIVTAVLAAICSFFPKTAKSSIATKNGKKDKFWRAKIFMDVRKEEGAKSLFEASKRIELLIKETKDPVIVASLREAETACHLLSYDIYECMDRDWMDLYWTLPEDLK